MNIEWVGLFRDGTSIGGTGDNISEKLAVLNDYITGTPEKPKKHFLLWFKLIVDDEEYIVSFDDDGDAYVATPDGRMLMTEYKIRSASLVFFIEDGVINIGFAGVNTCDKSDGKAVVISNLVANNLIATGIITV